MNNKQKKIYIAGKIFDLPEEEYTEKFRLASLLLMFSGYEPVNPVDFCSDINSNIWLDYMERCLEILPKCDGIYLLYDWKHSTGARLEKRVAEIIKEFRPDFEILEQNIF